MLPQLALASLIFAHAIAGLGADRTIPRSKKRRSRIFKRRSCERELTSTRVVQLYLNRIKAYNGTCVHQPDGVLGLGPITPIKNARQLNALMTLNLRPATAGNDWASIRRKARSMTDPADDDPAMPDALEVAAQQDAHFASTGRLIGPLHGVVLSIKDQYDTFDMRTTSGMDAAYANDRPPRDATFVKRLRDAGAIIIAKANLGEMGTPNSRSSFGGPFCNPYDTERSPGTSSGGSGSSVAANLVTCSIGEETGGSIHHPAKNNSIVGLAPTQELVSRDGMIGAALNTRVGPLCRTVKDAARVLEVIAGYDPKDELTAFSIGRLPPEPYRSFANERTLNGLRIGVIREHMDKKAFNEADAETIDITERAIGDLRRLGATIVDPGRGGSAVSELRRQVSPALSQPRVHRTVIRISFRSMPTGKPSTDHISPLVDMYFDPSRVPSGTTIRNIGPAGNAGLTKYMLTRYLRERGDANIKSIRDLIDKSKYYRDIRPDAGFIDRKAALEEMNGALDARSRDHLPGPLRQSADRPAMHGAGEPRRAGFSGGEHSRLHPGCTHGAAAGRPDAIPSGACSGQHGIPTLSVPAGFTTRVFDRVRDAAAPGGTRLVPVPAKLPVGIMFFGRPFSEPTLLRIASAYEAGTKHRIPPPDFGPVQDGR